MTTPAEYSAKHAEVLRAVADGHQMQEDSDGGRWTNCDPCTALYGVVHGSFQVRRKPPVIRINGADVPEPLRLPPPRGTPVFLADPAHPDLCSEWGWGCDCQRYLERGLLHLSAADAESHAVALLSFSRPA